MISYEAWKDRYRGDPGIIGRVQRLNGVPYTIIGVMPRGFAGTFVGYAFQFWVPASMEEAFEGGGDKLENRGARWIEGFAFLKPGVTIAQAQAELSAIGKRLDAAYPETNRGRSFRLYPLWQTPFNGAGTLLPTLRDFVRRRVPPALHRVRQRREPALVRSFARRHEMNVRLSSEPGAGGCVQQLLTESLILSIAAAAGGFLLAYCVPQRAPAAASADSGRGRREPARRNGSAGSGVERRRVPGVDPALRAGSGAPGEPDRPRRPR